MEEERGLVPAIQQRSVGSLLSALPPPPAPASTPQQHRAPGPRPHLGLLPAVRGLGAVYREPQSVPQGP